MSTTVSVEVDASVFASLSDMAQELGISANSMLNDVARRYVREERRKRIRSEFDYYVSIHPTIMDEYLGQHIAIYNRELVDHDIDPTILAARIRARFGRLPVMILEVEEQAVPELMIRSPRSVKVVT